MIADDSHSVTSPSTMVGALPFGFSAKYEGVFSPPASRSTSMQSASMPRCFTSASTRRGAWALIQ